jgi:leucine dehydrogenase
MFRHPEFDGHERVVYSCDEASGLRAIIAIHDTTLGPAFGGCRMSPYADEDAALFDVLRLSRGMTAKAAIYDLPWGGGKAVIIGDPQRDKTEALLKAMGRLIESLGGRYVTADDVGTTLEDLAVMRAETTHTAAATESARQPWPVTAYGVLMAIEATAEQVISRQDLQGLRVAVQGLGNVGMPLCAYLHERGAQLVVTDTDANRVRDARGQYAATAVAPDEIFSAQADLFAPCALGAILDDDSIPRLRVKAVCGGANNQLREPRHAAALAARGITFVPDYLVSAGGVIDFHQESIDDSPDAIRAAVERLRAITREVLPRAREQAVTPLAAADDMVRARLTAARDLV